jgi:hypothetical protein
VVIRVDAVGLDFVGAVSLPDITGVLLDQAALVLAVLELNPLP